MSAILEFVPRCSRHSKSMGAGPQCFSKCREEVEAALASKPADVEQVMPTDKIIRRESRVSHTTKKDPTAAVRRARWRKRNPEQHRDQQRAARARRKNRTFSASGGTSSTRAGKAGGS